MSNSRYRVESEDAVGTGNRCKALGAGKEPGDRGLAGEVGEVGRPAPHPRFPLWAPGVAPPAAA